MVLAFKFGCAMIATIKMVSGTTSDLEALKTADAGISSKIQSAGVTQRVSNTCGGDGQATFRPGIFLHVMILVMDPGLMGCLAQSSYYFLLYLLTINLYGTWESLTRAARCPVCVPELASL